MITLQDLPFDIHTEIAQHLDVPSAISFKKCSRSISLINVRRLPRTEVQSFLLLADNFPQNKLMYACFTCLHMLPRDSFLRCQTKGQRGKKPGGNLPTLKNPLRFCMDCAAKGRLLVHGIPYRRAEGKIFWCLCHKCQRWSPKFHFCGILNAPKNKDFKHPDWVCRIDEVKPTLQGLPKSILKNISEHLDYRSFIMLSSTNNYFYHNITPQSCTLHRKYDFTLTQSMKRNPDEITDCYTCFRLLPNARFTEQQFMMSRKNPEMYWKRRCSNCVWKLYGNMSSQRELKEWNSRSICGNCNLLRVNLPRVPCYGCVERGISVARVEKLGDTMDDQTPVPVPVEALFINSEVASLEKSQPAVIERKKKRMWRIWRNIRRFLG